MYFNSLSQYKPKEQIFNVIVIFSIELIFFARISIDLSFTRDTYIYGLWSITFIGPLKILSQT